MFYGIVGFLYIHSNIHTHKCRHNPLHITDTINIHVYRHTHVHTQKAAILHLHKSHYRRATTIGAYLFKVKCSITKEAREDQLCLK